MNTVNRQIEYRWGPHDQMGMQNMDMLNVQSLSPASIGLQTGSYSNSTVIEVNHNEVDLAWYDFCESFFGGTGIPRYNTAWTWVGAVVEFNPFLVGGPYSFSLDNALRELKDIRQEAEEAYALDNEIDPVPESAYDDALLLLKMLFDYNIPMPDISWAEDGSLGFEWRPKSGVATMGVYGDKLVIYDAFFEEKRQIEGICSLLDTAMLSGFLITLLNLLPE